ncbi:hypothetical protein J6590_026688 [Homalodisca vitripennis]|nr:hypothetical protein J6590_026688 [Homalodisca vitripennis]
MLICADCFKECDDANAIRCSGMCSALAHISCIKVDRKKNFHSSKEWRCKDCGNKASTTGSVASASSGSTELIIDFVVKRENVELRAENEVICQELTELRGRTRELEQYSRRNNIKISGLPVTNGESMRRW